MELSVKGFKSIASKQTISFNGLTILSGANSSGKSSFMQPFLILKQTIENHYDSGLLQLYGENARITDSSQVISRVPAHSEKSFTLEIMSDEESCSVTYKHIQDSGIQVDSIKTQKKANAQPNFLKVGTKSQAIEDYFVDKSSFRKDLFKDFDVSWKARIEKCFITASLCLDQNETPYFSDLVNPAKKLKSFVTRLIHVPGLRGNPERIYKIASSEKVYPGSFEKYVASLISQWSSTKKLAKKYAILKRQLEFLGLAKYIETKKIDDTSLSIQISRSSVLNKEDCVSIADVGFGVSQTLPVLVALLAAESGQYVYIEQPELHLHPKAQFKLADIIVEAIVRGVRVIIETHSAILIRGVQIAVVKTNIDKEKVSLNWFTQNQLTGETKITSGRMDKSGAFGDWPEDFDETSLNADDQYLSAVEKVMYD